MLLLIAAFMSECFPQTTGKIQVICLAEIFWPVPVMYVCTAEVCFWKKKVKRSDCFNGYIFYQEC